MRHRLACFAVFALLSGGFALPSPLATALSAVQQDPQKITVYVTRTGDKYHEDGCRYLSRSKIAMSLAEAAKRYAPCSVCKPPTVKG
jgi:hypothetical protein